MGNHKFHERLVEMAPGPVHDSPVMSCIKVSFEQADAEEIGKRLHQKAYRCPKCGKWHLTKHQNFKQTDRGRRR